MSRLLIRKFGQPRADAWLRLEGASDSDLLIWTDRVLPAATLDEIFA